MSEEKVVLFILYAVLAALSGVIWRWLCEEPDPRLPRELQFRLWAPEGTETTFAVLAGVFCPVTFPVLLCWCAGWFLWVGALGLLADIGRWAAEHDRLVLMSEIRTGGGE